MFEQVARISGAVNTGALDKAFAHPFLSLLIRARHFTISIFTSEAVKFVLGTENIQEGIPMWSCALSPVVARVEKVA